MNFSCHACLCVCIINSLCVWVCGPTILFRMFSAFPDVDAKVCVCVCVCVCVVCVCHQFAVLFE